MSYINMSFNDVAMTVQMFNNDNVKNEKTIDTLKSMRTAAIRVVLGKENEGYTFFKKDKNEGLLELKNAAIKVVAGYEKKMGVFARIVDFVKRKVFGRKTDLSALRTVRDQIKTKIGDLVVVTNKDKNSLVVTPDKRDEMVRASLFASLTESVNKAKGFENNHTIENEDEVNVILQSCENQLNHIRKVFNATEDRDFIIIRNDFENIKDSILN